VVKPVRSIQKLSNLSRDSLEKKTCSQKMKPPIEKQSQNLPSKINDALINNEFIYFMFILTKPVLISKQKYDVALIIVRQITL